MRVSNATIERVTKMAADRNLRLSYHKAYPRNYVSLHGADNHLNRWVGMTFKGYTQAENWLKETANAEQEYTRKRLLWMMQGYTFSEKDLNAIAYSWFSTSDKANIKAAGIDITSTPRKVREVLPEIERYIKK